MDADDEPMLESTYQQEQLEQQLEVVGQPAVTRDDGAPPPPPPPLPPPLQQQLPWTSPGAVTVSAEPAPMQWEVAAAEP